MASSKKKKKGIKKKVVKKVIKKRINLKKEIDNLKEEHSKVIDDIIGSTVYKKDIQKIIDRTNIECKKSRNFLKSLEITVTTEKKKISEFEGAVLILHELLTGEKVE